MVDDTTRTQTHLNWRDIERPASTGQVHSASKKVPAGVCGILLGAFGVHKFILGYTKEGLIMLLFTVLTLGFGGFLVALVGLIEGIVYLTKSDDEFIQAYVAHRRGWF
jgi:TM2 domain-containing membrane protein YozV